MDIADYFIKLGADDLNTALYYAAANEHRSIINYLISLGANDFDRALEGAAENGHQNTATYFISLGATDLNNALIKSVLVEGKNMVNHMLGCLLT